MAEDLPGPPGSSNRDDRPGERPTELLGGPAQPPQPPPSSGQPGGSQQPPGSGPPLEQQPAAQQYGYGQPGYGYPAGACRGWSRPGRPASSPSSSWS
jgi:hypothetical protein